MDYYRMANKSTPAFWEYGVNDIIWLFTVKWSKTEQYKAEEHQKLLGFLRFKMTPMKL